MEKHGKSIGKHGKEKHGKAFKIWKTIQSMGKHGNA
jgi:hypothetical protein